MVFNDTTNKQGLLQSFEFWAGLNDGDVTGDTTLKAVVTNLINRRLDKYMGLLGAGSRLGKIDDTNYNNEPYSTFDIVNGQHDYKFLTDEDGNAISDVTRVLILSNGDYSTLDKVDIKDDDAALIMSPNSDDTGTPTRYLERNNTIYLNPIPNYDLTEGGKIFYKRCPSYFTPDDTTKEPGIPYQFHQMVSIGAAYDWVVVNKPNYQTLITVLTNELRKWEKEFNTYIELRNPERKQLKPLTEVDR